LSSPVKTNQQHSQCFLTQPSKTKQERVLARLTAGSAPSGTPPAAVKPHAHARVFNLPYALDPSCGALNPPISRVGSGHIGRLVTLTGTVVKAGPVRVLERQRLMACTKCKHRCVEWGWGRAGSVRVWVCGAEGKGKGSL
jgi:DNA replicative helicase MCM subunit Mcm2 (Cdc46/Mcm family)